MGPDPRCVADAVRWLRFDVAPVCGSTVSNVTPHVDKPPERGKRVDLLLGLYVAGGAAAYFFALATDRRTWPVLVALGVLLLPTVMLAPKADRSEATKQWMVMAGITFCTLALASLLLVWS